METGKAYDLYKRSFEEPPPPLPHLQEVLGERGVPALRLWIDDLVSTGALDQNWEYGPLLSSLKEKSGRTLCEQPQLFGQATEKLSRINNTDPANIRRHLRSYC